MNIGRALWKLPGSAHYTEYKGIWENLTKASAYGFIAAPFNGTPKLLAASPIELPLKSESFQKLKARVLPTDDHQRYTQNVQTLLKAMLPGSELKKVVLSRIRNIEAEISDTDALFFELCRLYPHAACSLLEIEGSVWIGASPELLLHCKSGKFQTMSLAGTKTLLQKEPFGPKEEKEQALVTEEIIRKLQGSGCSNLVENGPYIRQAGHLLHLCTDVKGTFQGAPLKLAAELHPTPAVGGLPSKESIEWIHSLEQHDRGYFSGYLGTYKPWDTTLYVHLRCMEIRGSRCTLFAGAGITEESDAEEEWNETENKTQTLLSALFTSA